MTVLVTGIGGVIGQILSQGLKPPLLHWDQPLLDVRAYHDVLNEMQGHRAVVHLAWDMGAGDASGGARHADNMLMTLNVYRAAVGAGVSRVVMASSVHADRFTDRALDGLLRPYDLPRPDGAYGAAKCFMEALGRYYADTHGLEVVCIRFGGVNPDDVPPTAGDISQQVWLSHRDCVDLVARCLAAPEIPDRYAIVYAVSDNTGRRHDIGNPFGWVPQDGAR